MKLALFDLDHTLIPFDSGLAWTRWLIERGHLPARVEDEYLGYCHQYVAGTLDIHAMHRASLRPLLTVPRTTLSQWLTEFEAAIALRLPPQMQALVRRHRAAGDLCAIVTATTRFIAEPFARRFGIEHLIATEAATVDGRVGAAYTGEIAGEPCFREHKLTHVQRWLASAVAANIGTNIGTNDGTNVGTNETGDETTSQAADGRQLDAFEASWFYSDSISDLPLLRAVTHPVAVRPDERLRAYAVRAGWQVLD